MCGIFGWLKWHGPLAGDEVMAARSALASLRHRGPDASGEWQDDGLFLGHRRLSVIDTSSAANQPFHRPADGISLVYNGEIYNYRELREELAANGQSFVTRSDTEVLAAGLARHGEEFLSRLEGMYAFGWYDHGSHTLRLVRDPMGQKPIYYAVEDDGVIFASELGALLELPGRRRRLDRDAFARYLANSCYIRDETPVSGIRKLLPGHLVSFRRGIPGPAVSRRFWWSTPGDAVENLSPGQALDQFDRLFDAACARAMRADVPYGVFLSGGVDSTLVLHAARKVDPSVQAFTVAMGEKDYDESAKAGQSAAAIGSGPLNVCSMNEGSVLDALDQVLGSISEPHGDPGLINAYLLSRAVKSSITVALAGDGADELFAGYAPFTGLRVGQILRHCPAPAVAAMKALADMLPGDDGYLGLKFKARAYLQGFPATDVTRAALWLAALSPAELAALCPRDDSGFFADTAAPGTMLAYLSPIMAEVSGRTPVQALLHYYQQIFLPEFVCAHTDRAAMLTALEVRSPFLAPELISFANRLPDSLKLRNGSTKALLRQSLQRRGLPPSIVGQAKQGFTFPVARWLKGVMKDRFIALCLEGDALDGLIAPAELSRLWADHLAGRNNNYRILFNLMVFAAWRRRYPAIGL